MNEKLLRGYLSRRLEALQEIIDTAPVFNKRYNAAVDETEEVEELLDECVGPQSSTAERRTDSSFCQTVPV